jgi:hypothetical protein
VKRRFGCDDPFTIYGVGGDSKRFAEREARRRAGDYEDHRWSATKAGARTNTKDVLGQHLQVLNSRAGLRDGTLLAFITGSRGADVDTAECLIEKLAFALFHSLGAARPLYRAQLKTHLPRLCNEEQVHASGYFDNWRDAAGKWRFTQWITGGAEQEAALLGDVCPAWTCVNLSQVASRSDISPEEGHIVQDVISLVRMDMILLLGIMRTCKA